MRILISAGEASGDLYASRVVEALRAHYSAGAQLDFFGCAGPRMQAAGVEAIVDQGSLAVVGIVEVLEHIPRIYREFRKLIRAAEERRPDVAILTDSPDFHLRLAKKLRARGIPVIYLIAPQVWAWRQHRVKAMRRDLQGLLCIFPFEEAFFRKHGVRAKFIGHPLVRIVKPGLSRAELCSKLGISPDERIVVLLPGSRRGEVVRHMNHLTDAVRRIYGQLHGDPRWSNIRFVLSLPAGFGPLPSTFSERIRAASIQVSEGLTWDCIAQAELALAASGTVTIEAALLGTPMVTFYRVNELSWKLGRWMVRVPFLSMVNLVAGRKVVPELIQHEMTAERITAEAVKLLTDEDARADMRAGLAEIGASLRSERDPMEIAASYIEKVLENEMVHAR